MSHHVSPFVICLPKQAERQRSPYWLEEQEHSNQQEDEDDESRYVEHRRPALVIFTDPRLLSNFALSDLGQELIGPGGTALTCTESTGDSAESTQHLCAGSMAAFRTVCNVSVGDGFRFS